jgi:hypothetical protein
MPVNKVINRKTHVDKVFDLSVPVFIDVLSDLGGVISHLIHHLSIRFGEPEIILEKIAVGVNVCHYDFLVHKIITLEKVSVAGIVVNDHLVNLMQPVGVTLA